MERDPDSEILSDLSPAALAAAVQANLFTFLCQAGKTSTGEFFSLPGLARWATRIPHPWFNGVLVSQPPGSDAGERIEGTKAYFQGRGCDTFSWWLDPGLEPESWRAPLGAAGFQFSDDTPGMALDLASLPEKLSLASGLSIRPVESLADLRLWVQLFLAGYGLPADWAGDFYDLFKGIGISLPIRHYLGNLEGRPVAASTLYLAAGVAGIYDVATLPEARRRGLGAALTLAPLLEARRLGYRVGILQSSPDGFGVYRRLGFEQVCTMSHFYWKK